MTKKEDYTVIGNVEDGIFNNHSDGISTDSYKWSPSGVWWRDLMYFVGPGWFVCIAYVDPGNYQSDIQAGSISKYKLLWTLWWSSILSIYVQVLCVRLAIYGQVTLAEVQARHLSRNMRYMNWMVAELSTIITDLPEVIGVGIACNIFFGWPYWIGVIMSLFTTMIFLATMSYGIHILELIIAFFVGVMSVALFTEMSVIGYDANEIFNNWAFGWVNVRSQDVFQITGILGAVCMPHNLYLHTAACQNRRVVREVCIIKKAVYLCSWEATLPIIVSFFINMAVVSIAAQSVFGSENADYIGLTNFCEHFKAIKGGCFLFGVALLAAGQSSAITTTYTGQYVMDGFLDIRLPTWARALLTRLVAITPCVFLSALYPNSLDAMINVVNSSLSFLLSFALTPLVMYTTSDVYMGQFVPPKWEQILLKAIAFSIFLLNAVALVAPGGGMFGFVFDDLRNNLVWVFVMVALEIFYVGWHIFTVTSTPIKPMTPFTEERPAEKEF